MVETDRLHLGHQGEIKKNLYLYPKTANHFRCEFSMAWSLISDQYDLENTAPHHRSGPRHAALLTGMPPQHVQRKQILYSVVKGLNEFGLCWCHMTVNVPTMRRRVEAWTMSQVALP
jgi:hypothetical protein